MLVNWWADNSPVGNYDGIIAEGSIRSGKTFPMAQAFVQWAFHNFDGKDFAICGKTVSSVRRNIIAWLVRVLTARGYSVKYQRTENLLTLKRYGKTNYFYIFGGQHESSQDLIQGMTLAGVLFDEVALMPESFVNQATGRCSVEGSKMWFNCNPEGPNHWFKEKWLDQKKHKNLLHLHFTMEDNPSLSDTIRARYERMYTGVFYKRFILGLWVQAEGAIYDSFDEACQYTDGFILTGRYNNATHYIAMDYGTKNATTFLHIVDTGDYCYVDHEYYHSGAKSGRQKSPSQYADDFEHFISTLPLISKVIIDPAAAAFKVELKNRNLGFSIKDADNEVLEGIRLTASLFSRGILFINSKNCPNLCRELQGYVWNEKRAQKGVEEPVKQNDHGPDALRYFCQTVITRRRMMLMGGKDAA